MSAPDGRTWSAVMTNKHLTSKIIDGQDFFALIAEINGYEPSRQIGMQLIQSKKTDVIYPYIEKQIYYKKTDTWVCIRMF
jgi:hypothetical protein